MEGTKAAARKEAEEKRLDGDAVAAAPAAAAPGTSLDGAFTQVHRLKVESLSEFKVLGGLGTGATATVILARHCREHHLFAVKIFSKANVDVERVLEVGGTKWNVTLELERLQAERRILERLRTEGGDASAAPLFPFIAHCHAALQSRTCLCFVLWPFVNLLLSTAALQLSMHFMSLTFFISCVFENSFVANLWPWGGVFDLT